MAKPTIREYIDGRHFETPQQHDLVKKVLVFSDLWGPPRNSDAFKDFQVDIAALCEAAVRVYAERASRNRRKR